MQLSNDPKGALTWLPVGRRRIGGVRAGIEVRSGYSQGRVA